MEQYQEAWEQWQFTPINDPVSSQNGDPGDNWQLRTTLCDYTQQSPQSSIPAYAKPVRGRFRVAYVIWYG